MSKLFTVAGTSNLEGVVKFRVANGTAKARAAVLKRSGHTDINLFDLATPMSKEDAIAFVKTQGMTANESEAKAPKAAKPAKVAKAPKAPKAPAAKVAKPAKAPKLVKTAPAPKTQAEDNAPTTNSINEIARIKAKNLETMRAVTRKLQAIRSF